MSHLHENSAFRNDWHMGMVAEAIRDNCAQEIPHIFMSGQKYTANTFSTHSLTFRQLEGKKATQRVFIPDFLFSRGKKKFTSDSTYK